MSIAIRPVTPFQDQKPGTSGLRKTTRTFSRATHLKTFLQAIFEADPPPSGATRVVGGDGRYYSRTAAETTARMALANGCGRSGSGSVGFQTVSGPL